MTPAGLYIGACKGLVVCKGLVACKGLVLDCNRSITKANNSKKQLRTVIRVASFGVTALRLPTYSPVT